MYDLSKWCDRLIAHEGMKLMPYRCTAGKLTIGVGRNLEDNPPTPEEARALGVEPAQFAAAVRNCMEQNGGEKI